MERAKIVFPVRFSAGTHVVQTTTREMSMAGVFIRSLLVLPVGTRLALRLQLPRERAVEVPAVVKVATVEKERGFWAEFVDLSADEQQRIERTLRGPGATPVGAAPSGSAPAENRRVFPRYPARFRIRWAPIEALQIGYSANVSASGVFLQSDDPPPIGATLLMSMDFPGAPGPVEVKGLVAQRITKEEAIEKGQIAGVGIQFLDANDSFRDALDRAVEHIVKKA
jgi:Tfp pilus assembly protein PilZ